MSDSITNSTLSDELKEKVRSKVPDDFDFSSIGKIDLREAEKIANEDIVFLSEEDLIDGLEDFELIPVKISEKTAVESERESEISSREDEKSPIINGIEEDFSNEVLFEDFSEQKDEGVQAETEELQEEVLTEVIPEAAPEEGEAVIGAESSFREETVSAGEEVEHYEEFSEEPDEFVIAEEADVVEVDLDEMMASDEDSGRKDESEILKERINENNFDNQFDNIVRHEEIENEIEDISGIYDDASLGENVKFIDDSYVGKKAGDISPVFESDPLTENLVRMVDVSDGKLLVLDDIAESHDRLEYILDDSKVYDAESLELLFREERFIDDTDFDFIDNAIIRDDYTVYISEIDEYLKSRDSLSGSEVYEILGLLPEEIEDIDDKLFGDYYKGIEDETEIEFLSPALSFFDRGFIQKKELSYFTGDDSIFLEDEKISIEDDITSESAIIFEEDVTDIAGLLESGFKEIRGEVSDESSIEPNKIEEIEETTVIDNEDLQEILDITDRIVILEDRKEVERISSEFPEKRDELVKLLSYLDGLLEKLPEESIRKFAESEYFDLYSKVLKEIGK